MKLDLELTCFLRAVAFQFPLTGGYTDRCTPMLCSYSEPFNGTGVNNLIQPSDNINRAAPFLFICYGTTSFHLTTSPNDYLCVSLCKAGKKNTASDPGELGGNTNAKSPSLPNELTQAKIFKPLNNYKHVASL